MEQLISISTPEQLMAIAPHPSLSLISPDELRGHAPDAHWILLGDNNQLVARCSLWWKDTPAYLDLRIGAIGHYAALDAKAGHRLLQHACEQLAAHNCTIAVGPMDGNTWRRYRYIVYRGTEPPFFLEPDNPEDLPGHFRSCGFTVLARYSSAVNYDLSQIDERMERVGDRLSQLGVKIRPLVLQDFEPELKRIYQLSLISFRNNFLYTPIEEKEFIAQYRQIRPYINPELVLMAERDNQLVGFLFAIPDLLQAKRGEAINTIIIKTVAILPGRLYAGLGNLLVDRSQKIARELGYIRAIHALMHDGNNSRNLSSHYAQTMRRYTLFAKSLAIS